jgi:antitoxin VapB
MSISHSLVRVLTQADRAPLAVVEDVRRLVHDEVRERVLLGEVVRLDEPPIWPMLWHMPGNEHRPEARRASLFRNGRNQALRIPKVFELPGDEVMVHREGNRLIIEPITKKRGLLETLAELQPLDEELPNVDEGLLSLDDIDIDRG